VIYDSEVTSENTIGLKRRKSIASLEVEYFNAAWSKGVTYS